MPAEPGVVRPIRGLGTVVGDLSSVVGARLATVVLSLAGSVATTHLLAPADYTLIAYVTLGGMLLLVAASGWTSAAVTRYGREEIERTGEMRSVVWARVAVTVPILAVAALVLVGLQAAGALPAELTWPFVWMTLAIGILGVASDQMIVVLQTFGRMRIGARAGTARQLLLFAGLMALVVGGHRSSPESVALLMLAVAAALTAGLTASLWRHDLWPPRLDRLQLRRMLAFSLPLVAFSVSQYGISLVDIVVLRAFETPADVGVYSLAYTGYSTLQTLATSLTIVLIPLFVSLREGGRSEIIGRYFERLVPSAVFASSTLGGLLAPIGVIAVPLVFGDGFDASGRPFAILVAAAVLLSIASMVAPILMLHERTGATAAISVTALVVNVAGDLLLVGWAGLGVEGPALATTAALAVMAGGYIVVARRDLGIGPALHPALFLPLVAGILVTVLLSAAAGLACAALAAAVVLAVAPPFEAQDAELVARLDLPRPLRVGVARVITRLAR